VTYITNGFTFSPDTSGPIPPLPADWGQFAPAGGINTTALPGGLPWNHYHRRAPINGISSWCPTTSTAPRRLRYLPAPEPLLAAHGKFLKDALDNATRIEADIEMYVSRDPGLTNLTPAAILLGADKSLSRGGTEFLIYSNAPPSGTYYVGIKSEDQEASEFGFLGIFSELRVFVKRREGERDIAGIAGPIPNSGRDTHRIRACPTFLPSRRNKSRSDGRLSPTQLPTS